MYCRVVLHLLPLRLLHACHLPTQLCTDLASTGTSWQLAAALDRSAPLRAQVPQRAA